MNIVRPRHRWRCHLCIAFGYRETDQDAQDEFERHYWAAHQSDQTALDASVARHPAGKRRSQ
jgi:hypothetical protein